MIDYYGIVREFGMPTEERPPLPQPKRKWFGFGPWGDPHPAWQMTAMLERSRTGMTMWRMAAEIHRLRAILAALREPSEVVGDIAYDAYVANDLDHAIRAAVAAAEKEVGS